MRQKTLLVLALVALLVGAGLFFMPRPAGRNPVALPAIDPGAVEGIVIQRSSGETTDLRRDADGNWTLEHGGRKCRARTLMLEQLLQAAKEIRGRRVLAEAPTAAALDGYGLTRSDRVMLRMRSGSIHEVALGAALPSGGVAAQIAGGPEVVVVPAELRLLLFPPAADFVDPTLLRMRALGIERMRFQPRGAGAFEFVRQFTRWVLAGEKELPCDAARCDQLRNSVGALSMLSVAEATPQLLADFAGFANGVRVSASGAGGRTETFDLAESPSGRFFAVLEGAHEILEVSDAAREVIAARSLDLRDRRILRAETTDIVRVNLTRRGHVAAGTLVRTGELWDVQWKSGESLVARSADPLERARYLERLASLQWRSFDPAMPTGEPEFLLTVVSGTAGDRTQNIAFRHTGDDWLVTDLELAASGTLHGADVLFLEASITTMLERTMIGAGAYFAVGGVKLRIEGHPEARIKTTIPKAGSDVQGFLLQDDREKVIPEEIWRPVVMRLIAPTTARVLGRERHLEYGLDKPQADVSFLELERPSADGIAEPREGKWRSLRIGAPVEGGFAAAFDEDPAMLVFVLTEQDLAALNTLAVFAEK